MRTHRSLGTLVVAGVLVGPLAVPALADAGVADLGAETGRPTGSPWTLELGTQVRWFADTSAATVAPGAAFGPHITLNRRLVRLPGPRGGLGLGAFVRVVGAFAEGQIFQTLESKLDQVGFVGGARLDLDVWRGITASAQLDLGVARTDVTIGDNLAAMAPVDDAAWGFLGNAALGLKYDFVWAGHYGIGLGADLGYTVTAPVSLHAYPRTRPEDELSIPTMYAALGALDTRGITLAFSLRVGY